MSDLADEQRALAKHGADVEGLYEALAVVVDAHGRARQARKGTSFPYVIHPLRVGEILYRHELFRTLAVEVESVFPGP